MRTKRIAAYCGIDPTAPSLHVGHMLPVMALFWMYLEGYRTFTLIGGSTAKIGDPTGRLKSRDPIKRQEMTMNMTRMHMQLKKLWENIDGQMRRWGYEKDYCRRKGIINNNAWWNKEPLLEVLKRVGQHIRIGPMLSRDTVKRKMSEGDGMSFAEFTYPIMQGWDWYKLLEREKVQMQIGGSDQYGNIVAGIDVARAARDSEPQPGLRIPASKQNELVGFTVPLLTDSSGAKFGKSSGNALWLDPYMTSSFDLYGYFVRRPDEEVEKLLKLFTFLPLEQISKVMEQHAEDPSKRIPHHLLAHEFLWLVHGKEAADEAQARHRQLYSKDKSAQAILGNAATKEPGSEYKAVEGHPTTPNNAPRIDMILPESLIMQKSIGRIIYAAGLASSASEGHRMAALQKGIYVGGMPGNQMRAMNESELTFTPVRLWFPEQTKHFLVDGKILILRKGKHNIRVIEMVSDEEYAKSGQTYPGQPYTGAVRKLNKVIKKLKEGQAAEDPRHYLGKEEIDEVRDSMRQMAELEEQQQAEEAAEEASSSGIVFPEEKSRQRSAMEAKLEELKKKE